MPSERQVPQPPVAWEVRRNLEEDPAGGDLVQEPVRESRVRAATTLRWGLGRGARAAVLPLGPHSVPSRFAGAAVRVAMVQVPAGTAENLYTRPGPVQLLLVSTCLGPGPVPSTLFVLPQPQRSRPPLRLTH